MCGIAGFWNFRSGRPASAEVLHAMTRSLAHRGPDEDGFHVDGAVALGMRRLQVIDPAGGSQPMTNEDGTIHVVFNGEIYNHAELRSRLEADGHRFRSRSDTEAIVHGWEQWGPACVDRFNGMFAIAVWDSRRQLLFLARDRLGIKPLYVWTGPDGIVFGSELKAVVAAPWVPLEWDLHALDEFLAYEYVPAPRSIVAGVRKLPQGSMLLVRPDSAVVEPRAYWTLEAGRVPEPADERAAADGLRQHMEQSVRRRLIADVPLGAFLSGGIDSSIVVGLMTQATPGHVRTYSLGFEDRSYDELPYARSVASHFGTVHREERVTPDIVAMADSLAAFYDEPFGDVSAFPTFMISALARQEVTVALSGDGGDELFAGYDHYRAHRWAHRLRLLAPRWGWRAVDRLLDAVPPSPAKKGALNKVKRFAEGLRLPSDLEHARWLVFQDAAQRRALYSASLHEQLAGHDPFHFYRGLLAEAGTRGFHGLQRQLYADIRGYLADDILTKVDRASMAVSLEVRVPFLDHEVVEHAMAVPPRYKLRGDATKWLLRRAYRDMLPAAVMNRGKQGFSMPMKNWLRGPLQPLLRDLLDSPSLAALGWFDEHEVRRLIDEHVAGRRNHAHRLWCLMSLQLSLAGLRTAASRRIDPDRVA